ncbi:MAG TPA: hypothetical protein VG603_14605 [Chitinophagales bacterium]|nr:hypothetical protein [Chitinophagales bacterium]
MKYQFWGIIFMLSFSLGLVSGCHKSKNTPLPVDNYAASIFTKYQNGSYWVYGDSAGRIVDSESVNYSQCGPSVYYTPNYQECETNLFSNNLYNQVDLLCLRSSLNTQAIVNYYTNAQTGVTYIINFNNGEIDTTPVSEIVGESFEKYNEYHVNQFVFNNAIKIYNYLDNRYLVVAPGVGIVERFMSDSNGVVRLLRYHIVN